MPVSSRSMIWTLRPPNGIAEVLRNARVVAADCFGAHGTPPVNGALIRPIFSGAGAVCADIGGDANATASAAQAATATRRTSSLALTRGSGMMEPHALHVRLRSLSNNDA